MRSSQSRQPTRSYATRVTRCTEVRTGTQTFSAIFAVSIQHIRSWLELSSGTPTTSACVLWTSERWTSFAGWSGRSWNDPHCPSVSVHSHERMPSSAASLVERCSRTWAASKLWSKPAITHELPDAFGLVLDGWSDGGRHYIAIFAVFSDTTSACTGAGSVPGRAAGTSTSTSYEHHEDLDCPSRRFVLLAFRPLDDEEDLGAQSLYNLMADTLSRYDKPWAVVAFMVGDNCSVNPCIGRKEGAVPLIGCASHRFNLAMKDFLAKDEDLIAKVHAFMKRWSTLKGRALLRKVSPLAPVFRNETRWSSTYAMMDRYSVIGPCIRSLDYASLASVGHEGYLLSRRDHDKAIAVLDDLRRLDGGTKAQQRTSLTMSATRRLFDQVVENYPEMKNCLVATAPIVNNVPLETGLVKLQRGETLGPAERAGCIGFRRHGDTVVSTEDPGEESCIAKDAFKRRRVQRRMVYMDVGFVPPTSNECERFFSAAKPQITDLRKRMDVETIETVMMLSYNKDMWDMYTVDLIRNNGGQ